MRSTSCIIVFASVYHVIQAEKELLSAGLAPAMIPTPRELSLSCGQSLELEQEECGRATGILMKAGVPVKALYARDPGNRSYTRLEQEEGVPGDR